MATWSFKQVNWVIQQGEMGHLPGSTWSINQVNMVIHPGQLGHLTRSTWLSLNSTCSIYQLKLVI